MHSSSLLVIMEPGLSSLEQTRLMAAITQLRGVRRVTNRQDELSVESDERAQVHRALTLYEQEYYAQLRARLT